MLTLILLPGVVVHAGADTREVVVDAATLSPESAAGWLDLFNGRIQRVKSLEDGSGTTVGFRLRGDFQWGAVPMGNCREGTIFVRPYSFPFAAMVLVLPGAGRFPKGRKALASATRCLGKSVPSIGALLPQGRRVKIRHRGELIARLYLFRYREADGMSLQMPGRIGP